jgi:hypothetical protein
VLDAVATVLIYFFERHADGTEIGTIGDSLFWTSTGLRGLDRRLLAPARDGARPADASGVGMTAGAAAGRFC